MNIRICAWGMPAGVLAVGMFAAAFGAGAQDTKPSEEDLWEIVRQLQQRVGELEAQLEAKDEELEEEEVAAPAPAAVEERLTALEERLPPMKENQLVVYWKDALRFETADGRFKFKLGGRIHVDYGFFDDGDDFRNILGDTEDGVEFRRARLYLSGELYEDYEFKFQYDFAGGDVDFKDVYLAANNVPYVGQIKIGHFKEPFSLEELVSSNDTVFMERALPNIFAPSRNTGIQVANHHFSDANGNHRFRWAAGIFRDTDDFGDGSQDGGFAYTGRLVGLPWVKGENDDLEALVHVGLGATFRNPDDTIRFRQRPEVHLASRFVDTGNILAEDMQVYNAELAFKYKGFLFQSEYFDANVERSYFDDASFDGWYAFAAYVFGGERPYDIADGVFKRVVPSNNFSFTERQGWGAWEFAARFSHLDLSDDKIIGGEEDNWTLGVNWYLNPAIRIMLNYVNADIDRQPLYEDDFEALTMRFQLAF